MKNADVEQRWIDIWNDLRDLDATGAAFVEGESLVRLSLEDAETIVQDTVYRGHDVRLEPTWHEGRRVIALKIVGRLELRDA